MEVIVAMLDESLAFVSTAELRELILGKKISPVEITELYIRRIETLNGTLNAFITCTFDEALHSAAKAEKDIMNDRTPGLLQGVPIAVKDLEMTEGIRTTSGSTVYRDRIPTEDSVVVERIKSAGAVILGKTNTPEFGLLGETRNNLGDDCRNPWNISKTSGGSSGGSAAAVSSGMCSLATGSDGGGSIRIPASFTGTYGIKPTQGRVPRYPDVLPPLSNQTSQPGPIGRSMEDCALLMQVIAGYDSRDASSIRSKAPDFMSAVGSDIDGIRLGWTSDFGYADVEPEVLQICREAVNSYRSLGATVDDSDFCIDDPFEQWYALFSVKSMASNSDIWPSRGEEMTEYTRQAYEYAEQISAADFSRALGRIDLVKDKLRDQFGKYDLLLSPTMAVQPFDCGIPPRAIDGINTDGSWKCLPFTYPINLAGNPAASIPVGLTQAGLPVGLQIIGAFGAEEMVIAASSAFEKLGYWQHQNPPI